MVTKKDIHNMLKDLGIEKNDVVTIHISLKSVGDIENGAD